MVLRSLYSILLILVAQLALGQSNLLVGFNTGFVLAERNNSLIDEYNLRSEVDESLEHLKFISGFELGYQYGNDVSAITLSFSYLRKETKGTELNIDDETLNRRIQYSFLSFATGGEFGSERVRLGANLGYRISKFNSSLGTSVDYKNIVSEGNWVSKLYLQYKFGGSAQTCFAIRPYFELAWGSTNFTALRNELIDQNSQIYQQKFHTFGISFLFINGPQYD